MKVISAKWLDINEGDETNMNYRAKLVAMDFVTNKRDDLFAGDCSIRKPANDSLDLRFAQKLSETNR